MEKPKTKVYIDGANMFYAQKRFGWTIDWKKVKNYIENQKEVLEWKYYVGVKDGDEKMLKYLKYLNVIGFNTITKPLKKIKITDDDFIYKANFDVEITADTLLEKSKLAEVIIFSGDSDFCYLAKRLKDSGVKIIVFSSKKTVSWELKLESSKVFYLEDIIGEIKRE